MESIRKIANRYIIIYDNLHEYKLLEARWTWRERDSTAGVLMTFELFNVDFAINTDVNYVMRKNRSTCQ